ncbi:MAG: single-stranded-DNA-specific exonuclease RecJ [Clostridia bacterium]|nr:single-stranded-DNA-specific exonuclease RecJ [Clostridia bacterium]
MRILEQDEAYLNIDESKLPQIEGLSPWMTRLLYVRGARDEAAIKEFFNPSLSTLHDPMLFRDMDKAVARINLALERDEKICIFGDYDADGICATAILGRYLKDCGARVAYHIPSRHEHGYGMSAEAVQLLYEYGINLIITVDNGIAAADEVRMCRELGMDVIVTDHHRCQGELPECAAVIAHTRPDNTYPNDALCGAGVALKLVHAHGGYEKMLPFVPLAGLATIADIVPLVGENRVLAAECISAMNAGTCFPGLLALGRESKLCADAPFDSRDLSFGVIPRLNAAGRMRDARPGMRLLLSRSIEEASEIARQLTELNNLRKEEEQKIYDSAVKLLEGRDLTGERVIMLFSEEWNTGVVGIAASRLSERFYRPTMVFARQGDTLTGSARSIEGVDIFAALHANRAFLTRYGGHARAAGANLKVEDFEGLRRALNAYIAETVPDSVFVPRNKYELDVGIDELTIDFCKEIERLAPFGEGNPTPTVCLKNAKARYAKRIGNDGTHLKFFAQQEDKSCECVGYGMGYGLQTVLAMDRCRIIGTPSVNEWRGQTTVQLRLKAIAAEPIADLDAYIDSRAGLFTDAFYRNLLYNGFDADIDYEVVDADECALELLNADIAGSLILCFTADGARRLLNIIQDNGLWKRVDVRVKSRHRTAIAYNTALFAPVMCSADLSPYRSVLVYDTAVSLGMLKSIGEMAPNAMLFAAKGGGMDMAGMFSCNRESMGKLYNAARGAMSGGPCKWEDVRRKMREATGVGESACGFAINVFTELGFIERMPECRLQLVPNADKRDLNESALYVAATSLPDMNKRYVDALASGLGGEEWI